MSWSFTLFLAISLVSWLCCCQNTNCQEHDVGSDLYKPGYLDPFYEKLNDILYNKPTHEQFDPDFPGIPYHPKNQLPAGVTLNLARSFGDKQKVCLPQVLASTIIIPDPSLATDDEIQQLTEDLYNKETNSQLNKISVNTQGKTRSVDTSDEAPLPLLQVSEKVLESPIIAKLRPLFNHYEADTSIAECVTSAKLKEQDDFIDAVMATNVMRQAMMFLQNKGIVSPDPKTQRNLLKSIWFTLYSRGQGQLGSSGFEHVFLHEIKKGQLMGLHNWVYFNREEQAGRLDYKGYINKVDLGTKGKLVIARFTLNGLNKPVNSLLVGTSPELDMALYTVCFALRADQVCPVSLGGSRFGIQTFIWRQQGLNLIGSAYPKF